MPNEILVRPSELALGEHVTVWTLHHEHGDRRFGQGGFVKSILGDTLVITDPIGFDHTYNVNLVDICQDVPFAL